MAVGNAVYYVHAFNDVAACKHPRNTLYLSVFVCLYFAALDSHFVLYILWNV